VSADTEPLTGIDQPPVLLLHGVGSSFQHNWGRPGWLDLLADDKRTVIGFELPGHGPNGRADVEHADDLVTALLTELAEIGRPVDAVGFSAGGQLLAAAAAREPERFRRIAILGLGDNLLDPPSPAGARRLADRLETEPTHPQTRLFGQLARSAGTDPRAIVRFLRLPKPVLTAKALGAFTGPALVVIGERDDSYPADNLAAAFEQGRLVTIRGVDHFGLTSNPGCLEAVLAFLAEG
jgi:pimeloyl-ACP methyl ester carboxylesterase